MITKKHSQHLFGDELWPWSFLLEKQTKSSQLLKELHGPEDLSSVGEVMPKVRSSALNKWDVKGHRGAAISTFLFVL